MLQLELFTDERDIEQEMDKLKDDMTKLRKSLFAQQSDLRKQYTELAHDYQMMKLNLCKGKIYL
jgi:uncharacterized membrane-anchored protein YhcB (DUF1043 family)